VNYEKIVSDIIMPIVENKDALLIRSMAGANENELTIHVIAESEDIARLIGRGGSVADNIREIVNVAGKIENKRVRVKFESYSENKTEEE
jgi:hypothetical protein